MHGQGYATVTEAQRVASRNACARRNADSDLPSMATLTDPERVVRRLRRGTQPVYVLALDGDRLSLLPLLQPARLRIFWEAEREERVSEEYTDAAWRSVAVLFSAAPKLTQSSATERSPWKKQRRRAQARASTSQDTTPSAVSISGHPRFTLGHARPPCGRARPWVTRETD